MQLQSALLILLPVLTPLIGTSIAAIISQHNWPVWFSDGLAWFVLLAFAGGDMWANGQFAGGWFAIIVDAEQTITLLSSGWLVKLDPWLIWLNWLQSNLFNLVPLFEDLTKPPPINGNPITSLGTKAFIPADSSTPTTIPPRASADPTKPGA